MRSKQEKPKNSFYPPPNPEQEIGNGWQVSYLDIITLLLAFLIIILAISQTRILLPFSEFFQTVGESELIFTPIGEIQDELQVHLQKDIEEGRISIERELNDLRITFNSRKLYRSGEATLLPEARPLLDNIVDALQSSYQYNFNIDVEGHTDNTPIIASSYPSNWELSTARAANVVKYLSDLNVDESRLKASGYAYSRPLVPNEDGYGNPLPENMEQNRRIVLRIYQDEDQLKQLQINTEATTNSWNDSGSNCFFSLQTGEYQTLNNAMRAAKNTGLKTGFDFQLTYNNHLFSVRSTRNLTLSEAINFQSQVRKQLDNDQISIIRRYAQPPQWLHYQIQFGSFQQQDNALRFVSDLQTNFSLNALIKQSAQRTKVVSRSLSDLQTAVRFLEEVKQIEELSNSFIIYDSETVRNYTFNYQLQMASFRSESDAKQFLDIISTELGLSPEIQELEMQNEPLYLVVEKSFLDWNSLIKLREKIETYTNKQSIVHLIEIPGFKSSIL